MSEVTDTSTIADNGGRNCPVGVGHCQAALFNSAVASTSRSCDLVKLRVRDLAHGDRVATWAIVTQQKTQHPVQFAITEQTCEALGAWIRRHHTSDDAFRFQSRVRASSRLSTPRYARIAHGWVTSIGLVPAAYETHALRRTKASLIYRRTKNPRAVQLLLGYRKLESAVRSLGIELDDALEVAGQTEV